MFTFLWGLQPPKGLPAPKDPPNPWGFSAPCECPVSKGSSAPGKPQIPGHAQLPEGPSSPSTPQFPGGSPDPCGTPALRESPAPWGGQAALLPLSLVFVISAVAVAIKSGKCTGCPCLLLQGESSHCCPAPGVAGTGLGRCFEDKPCNYGQTQAADVQSTATAETPPQILMERRVEWNWEGPTLELHSESQRSPQNPG